MSYVIRNQTEVFCGMFWFGPSFWPLDTPQAAQIFVSRDEAERILSLLDDPGARIVPFASLPPPKWRRLPRHIRLRGAVLPRHR
jgi:hypothetical protein